MSLFRLIVVAALLQAVMPVCFGVALAPARATDDSVCDLAPSTTDELAYRTFISADAPLDREVAGYHRLASNFIATHCSQGQMLLLGSKYSTDLDSRYLQNLATELCTASDVVRAQIDSSDPLTNDKVTGYELRCRISKFDSFRKQLQSDEEKESTANLIASLRGRPSSAKSASGMGAAQGSQSGVPKQDCSRPTLSALMFGGGGCR